MPPFVALIEPLSNSLYILFIWALFFVMLVRYRRLAPERKSTVLWCLPAVFALAFGDSFHVIPRIYGSFIALRGGEVNLVRWLGFGKAASSFTLACFYLFLAVYARRKFDLPWDAGMAVLVLAFAVRVVMLCFPQNHWLADEAGNWKFYRNIPFAVQGVGVVALFLQPAGKLPGREARWLRGVAFAIVVSFVCYVAALVGTLWQPIWGMMMLPKTAAYVVAVWWLYPVEFTPASWREAPAS